MGAVIGRPDEPRRIYHNPAGLVLQHGWRIYSSRGLAVVRTEFQLHRGTTAIAFLGVDARSDGYYAPVEAERARWASSRCSR